MAGIVFQNVVVPIDFSQESEQALLKARDVADSPAELHLLHVLVPIDPVAPGVMWGEVNDETRTRSVEKHLQDLIVKHQLQGATTAIRFGSAGTEIPHYADEIHAELIVISSHGYHGVKRMLLGSVAERVIRGAHCPVLVLKKPASS